MTSSAPTTRARPQHLAVALLLSAVAHVVLVMLIVFDVAGLGHGFGIGSGWGFGVGAGGDAGLGQVARRQIFSLQDMPEPVRPAQDDEALKELLAPMRPTAVSIPQTTAQRPTTPVVQFARPVKPLGASLDLGARFSSSGAGIGGLGLGGGGGSGWSLNGAFGKYVGGLRKVGLDVALVIDSTGSMQNVIDDMKDRLSTLVGTMQRLVPTARIGAVAYRDRDDDKVATAPRQSENFVVRWSDLTFNARKVQTFLSGIVAEGGGDWEEAVKEGLETAMQQLKWRSDAKKVIILVASSPPHKDDLASIDKLVATWRARGGVISGIDVSLRLHEEHERKLNRWLYGEEPREVSPLPDFYKEVNQSLSAIATPTGGAVLSLGQDAALVRHLLVLTFGPQWEKDLGRVVRGM